MGQAEKSPVFFIIWNSSICKPLSVYFFYVTADRREAMGKSTLNQTLHF